ncbi:hypothetical protein [Scytonema sp. NUACC26]|uniref:hypothetical protein n=1 Tax=Scytonema sp. NUACC26 TaxID=3140176 RepID=UPI0034DC851D
MFNKMNKQKAVTNTTEASKGRELFGNWELSDSLGDEELKTIAGGAGTHVGGGEVQVSFLAQIIIPGVYAEL